MALTDDLSDAFFQGVADISDALGCAPTDLLGVMMAESNVRADAHNATTNASGLIQFLPSTLRGVGYGGSPESFRALDAADQLPYVEEFFQPYAKYGLNSAGRVYQAVFFPKSLEMGSSPDTMIAEQGGVNSDVYARNSGLDVDHTGQITVGDLQKAIERKLTSNRWREIAERAGGSVGGSEDRNGGGNGEPADRNGEPADNTGQVIDLQTREGIVEALEALGFDRQQYSYQNAVVAFQTSEGLTPDGVVGPKTRSAIASVLDENRIPYKA